MIIKIFEEDISIRIFSDCAVSDWLYYLYLMNTNMTRFRWFSKVLHPGCNIGCETLFSELGKLPLKLNCPTSTSTCPATLLNKGEIRLSLEHYLPNGASQGLFQLAPLPFFYWIHLQRATGYLACWHPCASDESSLSIGRVKFCAEILSDWVVIGSLRLYYLNLMNTNMTGFRWLSNIIASLCFGWK